MQKKILCLGWAENYGLNPLIRNQLISQLTSIKNKLTEWDLELFLNAPLISKKSILDRKNYFADVESVHREIRSQGVPSYKRWILAPSTFFHSQFWQLPFLYIFNILPFTFFLMRRKYSILHCRSYHATFAALMARKIGGLDYKVVFDTRGLFPEESVYHGHFKEKSLSFKMWKKIEAWALINSDCIVNVSEEFTNHIRTIVPNHTNIQTIHTTANETLFHTETESGTGRFFSQNKVFTLAYLGVLGPESWYSTKRLAALTIEAKRQLGAARLKIITRSNHSTIRRALLDSGLLESEIELTKTSNAQETALALEGVSLATMPVRPLKGRIDQLLMQVLIGAKTAEYLATGLPIIVFKEATGIADLVKNNHLGQIAEKDNLAAINFQDFVQNRDHYAEKTKAFSYQNFSGSHNAEKYITIYSKLFSQ